MKISSILTNNQMKTMRNFATLLLLTLSACQGRDTQSATSEWACKPATWTDSTGAPIPSLANPLPKSDSVRTLAGFAVVTGGTDSLIASGGFDALGLDVRRGDRAYRVMEGGGNHQAQLTRLDGEFPLWAGTFENCGAGSCMFADIAWGTLDSLGFSVIGKIEDVAPDQPPPLSQVAACPGELHVVWNGEPISIRRDGGTTRLVQWVPDGLAGRPSARSSAIDMGAPPPASVTTEERDWTDFDLWMRSSEGYVLEDGRMDSPCNRCEKDARMILDVLLTPDSRNAGPLLADTVQWNEKALSRAEVVRILADEQRQWLRTRVAYAGNGEAIVVSTATSTDSVTVYLARVGRLRTDASGKAERTRLEVGIAIREEDGKLIAVQMKPLAIERSR